MGKLADFLFLFMKPQISSIYDVFNGQHMLKKNFSSL